MHSYVRFVPILVAAGLLSMSPYHLRAQASETASATASAQASPSPQTPGAQSGSSAAGSQPAQKTATVSATALDESGDVIPGATVVLKGAGPQDQRTTTANDDGAFSFSGLTPGVTYHIVISAKGFVDWTSPAIVLTPDQFLFLPGVGLELLGAETSVTVTASPVQIATEQVK